MNYSIIIYIIFGILPSLVWLLYYLTKDIHQEPKRMILKIFLWGVLITLPVFFVQIGLKFILDKTSVNLAIYSLIYWFLIIAFSEEFFKYLVIKIKVIDSPHLDEPVDVMIYMVVAALGFAALENILYLFTTEQMSFSQIIFRTFFINLIRFWGAIFLHTLCSAVIGYSLAIYFCETKKKYIIILGIFGATVLHGLYNFSIITLDGYMRFVIPVAIILTLAFFVFLGFEKVKKMKGICKINLSKKTMVKKTKTENTIIEDENKIEDKTEDKNTFKNTEPTEASACGIFDEVGELVVDVFETNSDFVVSAAVAGIQIKDIDISLEKDMMVIKGNRCDPHINSDKKYFYQECYWGPFSRKIILPENIDIDKADAQIDKGILTIKIPRNENNNGNGKIGVRLS